jgi:hypothetical protein
MRLTDLINVYQHMKSDADTKLKMLEVENQQLREQIANLNQQIIASAVAVPPQHVERPSAPPMDPMEKNNTSFGTVIEL